MERQGSIALKDQLEKVGFKVELQLFDRPTVVDKRANKEGWNIHFLISTNQFQIHKYKLDGLEQTSEFLIGTTNIQIK